MFVAVPLRAAAAQGAGGRAGGAGARRRARARAARELARRLLPRGARAAACTREAHLDAFDQAFLAHFKGVEDEGAAAHRGAAASGCSDAQRALRELTAEERRAAGALDLERAASSCSSERLREQNERHDGGNRWIGTGGTSPFGTRRRGRRASASGGERRQQRQRDAGRRRAPLPGLPRRRGARHPADRGGAAQAARVRARGRRRRARPRRDHRRDRARTPASSRWCAPAAPAQHARDPDDGRGRLDGPARAAGDRGCSARRSRPRTSRSCAPTTSTTASTGASTRPSASPIGIARAATCSHECGPHYKLIMVGDALMAPYELMLRSGATDLLDADGPAGIDWLMQLAEHFEQRLAQPGAASAWWAAAPSRIIAQGVPDVPAHARAGWARR